mgnify:CR=1 FL=1|tara:strand:- start:4639 stop:5349 length:711 start_codon:yes stop_codon:yes gene_type:complete
MNKDNKLANFENFFLNETIEISLTNFIIALLLSAFLSYIIKKVYIYSSQTLSNKNYFSDLFIPLGIITCLVITVIKFSLALSLGLVGALSIVRFRAAIKEPEELIYLFLIIGIGLACGANQFLVAIFSTFLISAILVILSHFRRKNKRSINNVENNVLQIEIYNKSIKIEHIVSLINKYSDYYNLKSSTIDKDKEVYIFWIEFKNRSDYLKIMNSLKVFTKKGLNLAFYSSENIYE